MAKERIAYVCDNCGQESSKWIGKCPSCGLWNTFKEIRLGSSSAGNAARNSTLSAGKAAGMKPMKLKDIETSEQKRIDMGDSELNRVLGGGLVPGSIILIEVSRE